NVQSDEDGTVKFTNDFVHKFATNDGEGGDWFQNVRYDEELFYDEEYYCGFSRKLSSQKHD
ncbi:MAG: hypothetical protein VW907_07625, partial [Opitutae bacterium]